MKNIVWFSEGTKDQKELLGGKGANLAEMTSIGLPVPAGFIVTTDVCRQFLENQQLTQPLVEEIIRAVATLEERTHKSFGGKAAITGFCSQWGKVFHAGDDGYDSQLGVN